MNYSKYINHNKRNDNNYIRILISCDLLYFCTINAEGDRHKHKSYLTRRKKLARKKTGQILKCRRQGDRKIREKNSTRHQTMERGLRTNTFKSFGTCTHIPIYILYNLQATVLKGHQSSHFPFTFV